MSNIARLEGFLEGIVERSFARLFRSRLQPVELAKRLTREMENSRVIGVSSILVPNAYSVSLHATDFQVFASITASLEHDLCDYVSKYVRDHSYSMTAEPEVALGVDNAVQQHHIIVRSHFTERPPISEVVPEKLNPTQLMPKLDLSPDVLPTPRPGGAELELDGAVYSLEEDVVSIGRGLENSIVVEDSRVSRQHAMLNQSSGHWTIRDENSTNGTFVNGRMVSQHALKHGDRVSLGGLELTFLQSWNVK